MAQRIPAPVPPTALVTGAAKRVGRAIALGLARDGWNVAVHYGRSQAEAEETVKAVRALGVRATAIGADLTDNAATKRLIPRASDILGPVGLLVNSASRFERDQIDSMTRESWDAHLDPNLHAPVVLSQAFSRALPAENDGVIVNIIDQRVWNPTEEFLSYTVSKMALWGVTRTLACLLYTSPSPRDS